MITYYSDEILLACYAYMNGCDVRLPFSADHIIIIIDGIECKINIDKHYGTKFIRDVCINTYFYNSAKAIVDTLKKNKEKFYEIRQKFKVLLDEAVMQKVLG